MNIPPICPTLQAVPVAPPLADDLGLLETREPGTGASAPADPWNLLVVDDDPEVHLITRLALERFRFENRPVQLISAYSAAEAHETMEQTPDIALILLDVVMETDHAGLDFAKHVRETLNNKLVRIVLRTGQPGQAPPREVVTQYEIDDYRTKTELTHDRLIAVLTTALRNYRLLKGVEAKNEQLEKTNRQLEESERRARAVFEGASDGIYLTDADFIILDANPAACRMLGRSIGEVRGTHVMAHVPPSHVTRLPAAIRQYEESGRYDDDFQVQSKDGTVLTARITGRRVRPGLYVNILRDVTQQRRDEATIRRLAFTDLFNMTAFERQLTEAVAEARKGNYPTAVVMLRIGDFREINDTLGHNNGNKLLKAVGQRLRDAVFSADVVSRLGGSQFAVLVRRLSSADHLDQVINKIMQTFAPPFEVAGISLDAQASLGTAMFPECGTDGMDLLRCADVALGEARRSRQSCVRYSTNIDPHSPERLTIVRDLGEALRHGDLELYFQPKVDLRAERVCGVEALTRWNHPVRGSVSPDFFIGIAERTTLIDDLTLWVVDSAVKQAKAWHNAGLRLHMSVNVSLHNLRKPGFSERLCALLESAGLLAEVLTLEITETAAMEDPELVRSTLQRLRKLGVGIALDDFGIGHSSLAQLMRLPVSDLKLDKSFVMDINSPASGAIVRSSVKLAHDLKLTVTAEGVETREAYLQLKQMGCDTAQGFFISHALKAADLERWLKTCEWSSDRAATSRHAA
jgi:diguanylate cyclase